MLGMVSGLDRKNCWTIAEHRGDRSPDGLQHLLSRAKWDAEAVRDDLRDYVVDAFGDPGAVLVVGAGMILADVQAEAAKVGRLFPLSLASEGSCRIGGNLAANAGGTAVLRYGNARDLCLGLEAVLPDGDLPVEVDERRIPGDEPFGEQGACADAGLQQRQARMISLLQRGLAAPIWNLDHTTIDNLLEAVETSSLEIDAGSPPSFSASVVHDGCAVDADPLVGQLAVALVEVGGRPVEVAVQEQQMGTGHATLCGLSALPDDFDGVVVPGGFSYGDYLRCGAIAKFAPVMGEIGRAHV